MVFKQVSNQFLLKGKPSASGAQEKSGVHYYKPVWIRTECHCDTEMTKQSASNNRSRHALLLPDGSELSQCMFDYLKQKYDVVLRVATGKEFQAGDKGYEIDPDHEEDYLRLAEEILRGRGGATSGIDILMMEQRRVCEPA